MTYTVKFKQPYLLYPLFHDPLPLQCGHHIWRPPNVECASSCLSPCLPVWAQLPQDHEIREQRKKDSVHFAAKVPDWITGCSRPPPTCPRSAILGGRRRSRGLLGHHKDVRWVWIRKWWLKWLQRPPNSIMDLIKNSVPKFYFLCHCIILLPFLLTGSGRRCDPVVVTKYFICIIK